MMTAEQVREMQAQVTALQTAIGNSTQPVTTIEPGYTTTEFWSGVFVHLLALITIIHPGFHAPSDTVRVAAMVASGITQAVYTVGRSLRKREMIL